MAPVCSPGCWRTARRRLPQCLCRPPPTTLAQTSSRSWLAGEWRRAHCLSRCWNSRRKSTNSSKDKGNGRRNQPMRVVLSIGYQLLEACPRLTGESERDVGSTGRDTADFERDCSMPCPSTQLKKFVGCERANSRFIVCLSLSVVNGSSNVKRHSVSTFQTRIYQVLQSFLVFPRNQRITQEVCLRKALIATLASQRERPRIFRGPSSRPLTVPEEDHLAELESTLQWKNT